MSAVHVSVPRRSLHPAQRQRRENESSWFGSMAPFGSHFDRSAAGDVFEATIDPAELDQPGRVSERLVENRQIAPRSIVGDVGIDGLDALRGAFRRQPLRQSADLLGGRIVLEGKRIGAEEMGKFRAV
jgi:hypothetical protein